MTFFCTIYNQDYTLGNDGEPTPAKVTLVAQAPVRAASPRAAAAKVYVRCVGRQRARVLKEVLHAPATLSRQETDWRGIAPGLMRSPNRLGDCYCLDNAIEAWYIVVAPAALPLPRRPRLSSPRRLRLPPLPSPSPN
jgi:hypothetical protein